MAKRRIAKDTEEAEIRARIRAAGERARAEAEVRRTAQPSTPVELAKELGGRKGPEPARYGDWEKKGLISDF